jgi:hypothetical protein
MTVSIADTDVGTHQKPWWIYLAQTVDPPAIRSDMPGKNFYFLSWHEARELVQYMLDVGLLGLDRETETVRIGPEWVDATVDRPKDPAGLRRRLRSRLRRGSLKQQSRPKPRARKRASSKR